MSAPALAGRPSLRIRGTRTRSCCRRLRDPRLHLAAVIVTLQVLGQVGVRLPALDRPDPRLARSRPAILEVAIAFRTQRVIMWPASALLTGNGVAFILRVPGTEHGDWWSMNGWWIFAGDVCGRAAVEVPHPGPRPSHLQPVELRPRPLLPAPRRGTRRPTRALVGAAVPRARPRARADRRRRIPRSSGGCISSGSRSASGSLSPPGSACSQRAGTR